MTNKIKIENKQKYNVESLSLKTNFSWTLISNIIYAGCQWGILVVLAKLGSPEMIGRFTLALAITAPILLLTNLQLRSVQATDTQDNYVFGDYLGLRYIASIATFTITIFVIFFAGYPVETAIIIIIMCLAKIIESISDVVFGLLQKKELMDQIAISKILKGLLSVIVLGLVVWITGSLILGTMGLAISWMITLLFYDIKSIRPFIRFKPRFNLTTILGLVKLSLPLGLIMMMSSLNTNIPRYFLEYYIDEKTLGFFAAIAYLIVAGNTVISALGQSATPRLAKYYANGKRKDFLILILKLAGIGAFLGLLGVIISIFFGEELLTIIYNKDYASYSDVFLIIMIAGAINYTGSFLGYGMTAARSFKIQPYLGIIWVISSLIGSYFLIPSYGITGAAYVLILGASIQFVTKTLVLYYIINYKKT
ncbi:oligosaccharide flippase family protein [Lederbergia wuyishanensis]|uniref:O-antigen/teichoic acid export membrane protein n=1 Tax=Lederbergia wuyishanensis TaxID=1347903 RepID=A0ABU0D357_9BACI|nr:oligosaccharide flippase family protein [Lederbergia wuyishanensis]MCJ8007994.1 oligosaccharide flippase family protein [Lederbergia wuyishanensis]MDQ0342835.1 O-antigen/teichoic acid export membrane protein [Lederbergia wuyishanensis]